MVELAASRAKSAPGSGIQLHAIDNLEAVPFYEEFGDAFATKNVKLEHLV